MKRICYLILCAAPAALLLTSAAGAADFRDLDWGASKQEVRKAESFSIHHDMPNEIAFWNFKLAGVNAGLIYRFEGGRLVRAFYTSRHQTPDVKEDYADYRSFRQHFDRELGNKGVETWEWADGKQHSAAERTLEAVAAGRVEIVTRWEHPSNDVWLVINGKSGRIQELQINFEPKSGS